MKELTSISLFSGIGGDTLAAQWAGFKTLVFVENDKYCQEILKKHWPDIPIWSNIDDFKAKEYRGQLTLVHGGDPCQPNSVAGKRGGKEDDRYKWPEMLRVIRECQPAWVVNENPTGRLTMDFYEVLYDLESEGYEVWSFVIPACAVNAPHRRDRLYIVAFSKGKRYRGITDKERRVQERQLVKSEQERCEIRNQVEGCANITPHPDNKRQPQLQGCIEESGGRTPGGSRPIIADTIGKGLEEREQQDNLGQCSTAKRDNSITPNSNNDSPARQREYGRAILRESETKGFDYDNWQESWIEVATALCGVDDGLPDRVARLKALGNAQVPQQIYPIFKAIADIEKFST